MSSTATKSMSPTKTPPGGAADGNGSLDDWKAWTSHLARRKRPKPLSRLVDHSSVLRWPLTDSWCGSDSEDLVRRLERVAAGVRAAGANDAPATGR